jgi:hypothetical protein
MNKVLLEKDKTLTEVVRTIKKGNDAVLKEKIPF